MHSGGGFHSRLRFFVISASYVLLEIQNQARRDNWTGHPAAASDVAQQAAWARSHLLLITSNGNSVEGLSASQKPRDALALISPSSIFELNC
jgi:hypothetical protein